jgi:uncharacterized cupin superfamily protein
MSEYTIKNLKEDVDDSVAGRMAGVEGRFGRSPLGAEQVGVSYFRYDPNTRAHSGHRHREQEEAYVIVGGSGRIKLGDEIHEVEPWDVIRVAPRVARGFEAGPDGLEYIAIGGPRPEGGDGEMVEGFWGE